jgi:hypothetical protein
MRVRASYYTFTPSQGCGTIATYGNIMDFEVNVKAVSPPAADFAVPTGPNFIKTPIGFNSTTTSAAYNQKWSFQSATSIINTGAKGRASWPNTGYFNVKLVQQFQEVLILQQVLQQQEQLFGCLQLQEHPHDGCVHQHQCRRELKGLRRFLWLAF